MKSHSIGLGILHDYIAASAYGLVPVIPELTVQRKYWSEYHETLRESKRVQIVKAFLAEIVDRERPAFVGQTGTPATLIR